jgi:hypothetical protein
MTGSAKVSAQVQVGANTISAATTMELRNSFSRI